MENESPPLNPRVQYTLLAGGAILLLGGIIWLTMHDVRMAALWLIGALLGLTL